MLIALIGREPAHAELFGHALIPEAEEAMSKSAEPPISIGKSAMKALAGKGLIAGQSAAEREDLVPKTATPASE